MGARTAALSADATIVAYDGRRLNDADALDALASYAVLTERLLRLPVILLLSAEAPVSKKTHELSEGSVCRGYSDAAVEALLGERGAGVVIAGERLNRERSSLAVTASAPLTRERPDAASIGPSGAELPLVEPLPPPGVLLQPAKSPLYAAAALRTQLLGPFGLDRTPLESYRTPVRCGDTTYQLLRHEGMCRNLIEGREWEPHIRRLMERLLRPGDCVIDVGAAFGVHTLTAAALVGDRGRVIALEPQEQFFSLLLRNCIENARYNVVPYCAAAAEREGRAGLRPVEYEGEATPMADVFLVPAEGASTYTSCVPLDSLEIDGRTALVKIDVQGSEAGVVEGARALLARDRPLLIVEFELHCLARFGMTPGDLFRFVRSLGYYVLFLDYEYPSDHLCVPLERLDAFRSQFSDALQPHFISNPYNSNVEHGVCEKLVLG